jgi:hypothetical protein
MGGIALNFDRFAVLNCDQDAACVRTVMRAGSMHNLLHQA